MAAFIKFQGIEGESGDNDHKKWSDLASFSQPMYKPGSGTGQTRRRGDVVVDDMTITKELDKASPKLAEAICGGKVFGTVNIELTASYGDAGRKTYYAYELKNVQVVNYTVSGAGQSDEVPMEQVTLNFEEIKLTYTERKAGGDKVGTVDYAWKVEAATT